MESRMRALVYGLIKRTPVVGPFFNLVPPFRIQPERLYVWTHVLMQTRHVPGSAVEVGCSLGGTAMWSDRMLRQTGVDKTYVAIDTFNGFVPEQFETDVALGTPKHLGKMFSYDPLPAVRRSARKLGAPDVLFVQGDICSMPDSRLPRRISASLVDVDLSQPVYSALDRVYPRLAPEGMIVVDDCPEGDDYKARIGYQRFVAERGFEERYVLGMGVVAGPECAVDFGQLEA